MLKARNWEFIPKSDLRVWFWTLGHALSLHAVYFPQIQEIKGIDLYLLPIKSYQLIKLILCAFLNFLFKLLHKFPNIYCSLLISNMFWLNADLVLVRRQMWGFISKLLVWKEKLLISHLTKCIIMNKQN